MSCNKNWEALGKRFSEHPFNVLDEEVFAKEDVSNAHGKLVPTKINEVVSAEAQTLTCMLTLEL